MNEKSKEIMLKYIERTGDLLEDFNEKQLNIIFMEAYEEGHSSGIEETIDYAIGFICLIREVKRYDTIKY